MKRIDKQKMAMMLFILLYTEDFAMCHYFRFSQIGSHISMSMDEGV